jgi:hypothetical protein
MMIRKFFETISAMIDLRATEIREGITLAEAVAADATRGELLAVTGSQFEVQKALEMSVELAKNGINDSELLEQMIRYWYRGQMLGISHEDLMTIATALVPKRRTE